MIKLTIEIEETPEQGITSMSVKSEGREEATTDEILTWMVLRKMLQGNPAVIGHGHGETKEESQTHARQNSEISRAILKAGRPKED